MFDAIPTILQSFPRPTVFELGGHIGDDTQRMLNFAPEAQYHLFEPDPRNIAELRTRGLMQRVQVVEAAIGSADGFTDLYLSSGSPVPVPAGTSFREWSCSSSIKRPRLHLERHPWCQFNSTATVRVRSLDSYCQEQRVERIDFIWADIQGAEADMIAGGQESLARTRYLVTEYCNEELYEGQPSLGQILASLPGRWRIVCCDGNDALFCNESFNDHNLGSLSAACDTIEPRELSLCVDELLTSRGSLAADIRLSVDESVVGLGDLGHRNSADTTCVATRAVNDNLFQQPHRRTDSPWSFRIVMPTSNEYAQRVVPISLVLLRRFWPDHPNVDVIHFEQRPTGDDRIHCVFAGRQSAVTWTTALLQYLECCNRDDLVFLMLDDYGLCAPAGRHSLFATQAAMLANPRIANVHLSWLPVNPKAAFGLLHSLPQWPYSVNTQAALWRRSALVDIAMNHAACAIEEFETSGSVWFNAHRFGHVAHCQVAMPEPSNPSNFTDETDKTHWALPYHNLMRRGTVDSRHLAFLDRHGLSISR